MAESTREVLRGRRILIVEDDYIIAADLAGMLQDRGVEVVGPVASVAQAIAQIGGEPGIDAAIVDINLGSENAYPVADALLARGVPFAFTTGYHAPAIPADYAHVPRCEKPVDSSVLEQVLAGSMSR